MMKKEIVLAALVASVLTVGTARASAAAGCMEACAAYFGRDILIDDEPYSLDSCTESANNSGSTTTCYYS